MRSLPRAALRLLRRRSPRRASLSLWRRRDPSRALTRRDFGLLALIFVANVVLAAYHSGVEAHLWQGPTACTGVDRRAKGAGSLLDQLATVKVVNCDVVQLRVFGLSLANWNVLVSGALAALAARATVARG